MKITQKKEYSVAADILRILAILAVVLIHTSTKTLNVTGYHVQKTQWSLFLNQSARFAVPLFFLISGFVLEVNYRENFNYKTFFKKRAIRIIIPYCFWSVLYDFFFTYHKSFGVFSIQFGKTLLLGTASYQLYFIPSLIIFYVIFPLLHRKLRIISKWVFIIPLTIIEIILLSIEYHFSLIHLPTPIRIVLLNYLLFIFGMIAAHHKNSLMQFAHKKIKILLPLCIISPFIVFFESEILFSHTRNITYIYSQYHPTIFLYTLLLGLLVFYFFDNAKMFTDKIATLARLSFPVFFIHVAVLEFIWEKYVQKIALQSQGKILENLWFDPLLFIAVTCISFLIVYILHFIPKSNLLVG